MPGSEITIKGPDGSFGAYCAMPRGGRGPGLVVLQEMYGVNGFMRYTCDEYAKSGFLALCPDLYWRQKPGVQLTDASEAELDQAFKLMDGLDRDKAIADIRAAIAHLRSAPGANGRVGALGFCLGGLLAYLTAVWTDIDAAVGYYGVDIDKYLAEKSAIKKPLMLHIADEDTALPKEDNAAIKAGLAGHPLVTIHSYPGLDHAFARVGTRHFTYDARAADLANRRTLTLLNDALVRTA
jgi:carboxymethylenebutenolidase